MYSDTLQNLYIHRLRGVTIRDEWGHSLTERSEKIDPMELVSIAKPFNICEDKDLLKVINSFAIKPDFFLVGNWVPYLTWYNKDGSSTNSKWDSFITTSLGNHIMLITGLPTNFDISGLVPPGALYVNEVYDKVKKVLYVIIDKNS